MASLPGTLFLSIIIFQFSLCYTQLVLPITKHKLTNQYFSQINIGTPLLPTGLIVDLNNPFLWKECSSPSSSQTPIPCRSIQCSAVNASPCSSPTAACTLHRKSTITEVESKGELVEDVIALQSPYRSIPHPVVSSVDQFMFSCGSSFLLNRLANGAKGVLGLGKSRISFPSQYAYKSRLPQRFSLCLSSNHGMVVIGESPHLSELSKSLVYTPLNEDSSYSINVKSIKIDNAKISLGSRSSLLAKISTVVSYTKLHGRIYETFLKAFIMAADSMNMSRVPSVAPFGACYRTMTDIKVPVIDLILQSEMVNWKIYEDNSMVKVGDEVMCLGFVDGGLDLGADIVVGGYQLEDNLLEFDFGSSMLGFSSSLVMKGSSCNEIYSDLMYKNLQSV